MKLAATKRLARTRLVGTKLRDSLFGLLRRTDGSVQGDIDGIRRAMLDALGVTTGEDEALIERQILFATDVETLWYARTSLMHAIAYRRGEAHARNALTRITGMFPASNPMFRHKSAVRRHH